MFWLPPDVFSLSGYLTLFHSLKNQERNFNSALMLFPSRTRFYWQILWVKHYSDHCHQLVWNVNVISYTGQNIQCFISLKVRCPMLPQHLRMHPKFSSSQFLPRIWSWKPLALVSKVQWMLQEFSIASVFWCLGNCPRSMFLTNAQERITNI